LLRRPTKKKTICQNSNTFGLIVESIKELRGASIVVAISLGTNGIMNVFTIFTFIMVVTMTVIIIVFNNGVTTSFLQ